MSTLHDRIFKEFFHRFLPDFVHIFFPEMAAQLNFATLTFVTQELMVNLPQRILRITDVVAEVETWSGDPQVIIVLVEVEANRPAPLPQRMFEYYGLLRLLLQKPIFPIAFLPLHKGGVGWRLYQEELFGRKLGCLHYGQVGLRDLLSPTYLASQNPVAAALAVLMDDPANAASQLKLSALQRVHTSQLTEGDKLYLIEVMETYLPTAMLPQAGD
ncbi:MAG TPA: hypothetical protein ENJ56_09110, partial [Anaerolineae bacterium]|nr:hypothetical protein [Anaerolineae bacterium]